MRIFARPAFELSGRVYTWEEVIASARMGEEWGAFEESVWQSLSCRQKFLESEEAIDEEQVEAKADEFRYTHNLITAEEMEAWANARGLSVDEWMEYIEETVAQGACVEDMEEVVKEFPADEERLPRSLEIHGICSGKFLEFSMALAGRATLYEKSRESVEITDADLAHFRKKVPKDIRKLKDIDLLLRLEAFFSNFRKTSITPEVALEFIQSRSIDFIRFSYEGLIFSEEPMAAEASLCIQEDGMSMETVASDAGVELYSRLDYLNEIDPNAQAEFLSAQPGELVGPLALSDGTFALFRVLDKIIPDENDPEVLEKAGDRCLNSMMMQEVNTSVRWFEQL